MSLKSWHRADSCAKVAASLFLACKASINPLLTRLMIPSAIRAKGYSKEEAVNWTLQQQVRREVAPLSSAVAVFFSPPTLPPYLITCRRPFGLQLSSSPQLSSATTSCQLQPSPPLHRCLASLVCWLTPPNHCLSSVAKAVATSPLVRAVISSCLLPWHSLMADFQVVMCWPPPSNHPL
jgi:hypothetical protein